MEVDLAEPLGFGTSGPQTPSTDSPAARTSAISTKISAILSASYADIEIRDSLETLDDRRLRNDQDVRRNLRRDVQKEVIDCNGEVIDDFGRVASQLRTVGSALDNLQKTCAEMRRHIQLARVETAPMLDEANVLMEQKNQLETKQNTLSAFNAHFVLDETELAALTSGSEPVGDTFFQAVVKSKRIHKDCEILLGTENQRLGLEILEQNSKNLNAGFQKLYRWVQREFKSLDLENPRITSSIRRALRVLAERPTLFQNCLDAFAEARDQSLMDAFYAALTSPSSYASSQKPIEFFAHEPLRYVGDMLAWAHSTTVSEREALEGLFITEGDEIAKGIQAGLESEPWTRAEHTEKFDGRKALNQLVDRSLAGVAELLQQRIDQVVQSHDEAVLAYKVANLVAFYKNIFRKLVEESGFLDTLSVIQNAALDRFRTAMHSHLSAIQRDQPVIPRNLTPPEFLGAALDSLHSLLQSYETSLTAANTSESGLDLLLTEALDPFLAYCDQLASESLEPPSSTVFSMNCLLETRARLSNYPFVLTKIETINSALAAHTASLVSSQHDFLRASSGLQPLLSAIAPALSASAKEHYTDTLADLSKSPVLAPDALMSTGQQLDAFLPSAIMDATARLKHIRHANIARDVTAEAAGLFCEEFETLEEVMRAIDEVVEAASRGEEGGDGEEEDEAGPLKLRDLFPRTGEEIRILLS